MNMEKKYKLKETLLPWNSEEDIDVYFTKLQTEHKRLKSWHQLVWRSKSNTGSWKNVLKSKVWQGDDGWLGG